MPYIGNPIYQSAFVTDSFSGTGSQTAYTMSVAPAGTTNVLVVVSGVVQDPSTYGVVGNTLTFSTAPPSGTGNISCRYLGVPVTGVTTTAYRTVTEFTATASQTTFTPPSYTVGFINVYLNGVRLGSADYTASNGTTVVLATGASVGNLVTVESFLVSSVLNALPQSGGTLSGNLVVTGTETINGKLAVGTTNSSWGGGWSPIDVGPSASIASSTSLNDSAFGMNTYYDGSNWKYKNNGYANLIYTNTTTSNGSTLFYSAASGTAGNNISFANTLSVGASGKTLALENASPATGTGISFPATQSSSSDPNTLDDYEEGTWTPVLTFGGGSTGITYGSRTALYTKVGNTVYVAMDIVLTNKGSSTGSVWVTGLPFAYNSSLNNVYTMPCLLASTATSVGTLVAGVYLSNLYVYYTYASGYTNLQNTAFSNTSELTICGTYLTQT